MNQCLCSNRTDSRTCFVSEYVRRFDVQAVHGRVHQYEVDAGDYSSLWRDYSPRPFRHIAGTFLGCTTRCGTRWLAWLTPDEMLTMQC